MDEAEDVLRLTPKRKPPQASTAPTSPQPNQLSLKINGQTVLPLKRKSTDDGKKENQPPSSSPPSIPNDDTTFPQFKFKNNGNKKLLAGPCKYYICCQKGCPAKRNIRKVNNKESVDYTFDHNYYPPSNPHPRKEVKERAEAAIGAGATPGNVFKQLLNNAPLPISPADMASLSRLKNWKYAMSVNDMPSDSSLFISNLFVDYLLSFNSGDVYFNINYKHNGTFLQLCNIASTRIVLASSFGLDILANSKYVIVDGTHETCKQKVTLTTLLGFKDDVALPCAYFLSKAKDTETYECFYEVCCFFHHFLILYLCCLSDYQKQDKEHHVTIGSIGRL